MYVCKAHTVFFLYFCCVATKIKIQPRRRGACDEETSAPPMVPDKVTAVAYGENMPSPSSSHSCADTSPIGRGIARPSRKVTAIPYGVRRWNGTHTWVRPYRDMGYVKRRLLEPCRSADRTPPAVRLRDFEGCRCISLTYTAFQEADGAGKARKR